MQRLRKILFYLFVGIYLIVCPLIILRMLGFIHNPQTGQFVKTGILYISTNPPGANVFINEIKAPEVTPAVIRDLLPGEYTIRLDMDGYRVWKNSVPLMERKATTLENILLIPTQWNTVPLSNNSFDDMLVLGEGSSLLLWKDMSISSLHLLKLNRFSENYTLNSEKPVTSAVFPAESIYSRARIIRFFTVEKSPFIVLHIMVDEKQRYLWVDTRDRQAHVEDISDLIPLEPLKLRWEPGDERNIFVYLGEKINRIDIRAKAIYPDIPLKDVPVAKDTLNLPQDSSLKSIDEANGLWLGTTTSKLGIREKGSKNFRWIYDQGGAIEQAWWANSTGAILFRDGNEIFIMDKEGLKGTSPYKITAIKKRSGVHYSEKTGRLFYLDAAKGRLSMISILRHQPILPKNIADTLRLKKTESRTDAL